MPVKRGASDHTPPEIPDGLCDDFLDRMWRAHEAQRRGDVQACLEIAFDGYVEVYKRAGGSLTHALLREQIPASIQEWAVKWRWRPPSPSSQFQSAQSRLLWYRSQPKQTKAESEGVPSPTLGVPPGCKRFGMSFIFTVTQWTVKMIRSRLAHRIAFWTAKERLHEPARPEASSAKVTLHALLKQICKKKKINIDDWLIAHDIDRSQYYVFKKAGGKSVVGKVPVYLADKIKAAILHDAVELGLTSIVDLATEI